MVDFIVVGGGVIGLLTCRELALAGANVVLLERGATGQESSWAGGGILSPLYPWRYPDSVTRLAQWSQARYPELIEGLRRATGVDPELARCGLIVLEEPKPPAALAWAARFGYEAQALDSAALAKLEPRLAPPTAPGIWMPTVAHVRNPRLVRALRQDLEERGVRILEQREVLSVLETGGRAEGVLTDHGPVQAPTVIVAAGAWSARLLEALGGGPEIYPVRGQMIILRTTPGFVQRIVLRGERYLIPRRDGRVLAGSTREQVGFVKETTSEARNDLRANAVALIPELDGFEIEHHWCGLRPAAPAGIPYIGVHPKVRGLYVNAGHFRNGLVLAPASARLLADLVLGREPILPPQPYALEAPRQ